MATLYDSSEMFTGTDVRTVPSLWQRFGMSSIASHRQRQANQYLAEYLRRHPEYQEDFGHLTRCAGVLADSEPVDRRT
jgi:hypothetical protein